MFNIDRYKQKSPQQRFLLILGLAMFALYFALGLYFIFWKDIPFNIATKWRIAFGVLLIVYSFIRFTRLISQK